MTSIKARTPVRMVHIRVPEPILDAIRTKASEEERTAHAQLVVILKQWYQEHYAQHDEGSFDTAKI